MLESKNKDLEYELINAKSNLAEALDIAFETGGS